MELISVIQESWGWCGIDPSEITDQNEFGNVLIRDNDGAFWRICPEDVYCKVVAANHSEFEVLKREPEFREDWAMASLVAKGIELFGELPEERCYCLKIPGLLGGAYDESNIGTITRAEAISFSGHLAQQAKDLPDGAQVILNTTDSKKPWWKFW